MMLIKCSEFNVQLILLVLFYLVQRTFSWEIFTNTKENITRIKRQSLNGCKIPHPPENGSIKIVTDGKQLDAVPGTYVSDTLEYSCNAGFQLSGCPYVPCVNGNWPPHSINCIKTCPNRQSSTVNFECSLNNKYVSCDDPIAEGTQMKMTCKEYHKKVKAIKYSPNRATCHDGKWDNEIIRCEPICGIQPQSTPLVVNGRDTKIEIHPWHVGIYILEGGKYKHICGGTIINTGTVLSAAHCFIDSTSKIRSPNEILVAAGKTYRDLDDPRDKDVIQKRQVKQVILHSSFKGYKTSYKHDIALVKVDDFKLTYNVGLICIDWDLDVKYRIEDNATVVGWGFTERGLEDPHLKQIEVPIVPTDECEDRVPNEFIPSITTGKFCAGYFNKGAGVCLGDSGGGLVAVDYHNFHFLRGIVSAAPRLEFTCDHNQIAVYTNISTYLDFLNEANKLETCPNQSSETVDFECSYQENTVSCDGLIIDGTVMKMRCKPHHEKILLSNLPDVTTCLNGKWTNAIIDCEPYCGVIPRAKPLIVGGMNTSIDAHPWHVGIYAVEEKKRHICGGTIVGKNKIISAAHCFTHLQTNKPFPNDRYLIAAGKNYRELQDPRDVQTVQIRESDSN